MAKEFDVREKILKKSVDLFYKHGYVKGSIRTIAKAVGISNSTAYIYFENKDEILFSIIHDVGEGLLNLLQGLVERYHDPVECLHALISEQIIYSIQDYKRMRIYLEEQYQLPPRLRKKAHMQHRRIYDLYFHQICDLEEKGLLMEADKTVMTFSIIAMMNWIYRWFDHNGPLSIEQVIEDVIKITFNGILKKGH